MIAGAIPKGSLVLAVHPFARGMGWVAFEGPFSPYDWGFSYPKRDRNLSCVRKLGQLLKRLQPETLVIETSKRPGAAESPRIKRLYQSFVALAADRGIAVGVYSRGDIRSCFASVGAVTRQEIAEAVARHIAVFEPLLPTARRKWEAESRYMALFNAAALALTHYQLERLISPEELMSG
jgi:Holliday junction resolvasome RuvABC endonuclease subunit